MLKELFATALITFAQPAYVSELTPGEKEDWYMMQTTCLAQNVYHEARNQGTAGQLAVIAVTLNRVNDDRFPNSICGVVYEGQHRPSWKGNGIMVPVRHKCQFSWYCDGKSDAIHDHATYETIYTLSEGITSGLIQVPDITDGATFYHADYVSPSWAAHKTKTIEIEDHIFYKWRK